MSFVGDLCKVCSDHHGRPVVCGNVNNHLGLVDEDVTEREREIPEEVRRELADELNSRASFAESDDRRHALWRAARALTGEYAVSLIRERAWCYEQEYGSDKVSHYLQTWANELEQKGGADGSVR